MVYRIAEKILYLNFLFSDGNTTLKEQKFITKINIVLNSNNNVGDDNDNSNDDDDDDKSLYTLPLTLHEIFGYYPTPMLKL